MSRFPEEAVRAAFQEAQHQAEWLIAIYRLVFPEWDQIDNIQGWPICNTRTWETICRMAITFDEKHHPEVLAGGLWL